MVGVLVNALKAVLTYPHSGKSSCLRSRKNPGTVDPECDVTEICKETAEEVRRICRYYQMPVPNIGVETHDVTTEEHADLKFAFIPGIINYIVQEILKNSCRATLELYSSDLDRHPIQIIICGTTLIGSFFGGQTRHRIKFLRFAPISISFIYLGQKYQYNNLTRFVPKMVL